MPARICATNRAQPPALDNCCDAVQRQRREQQENHLAGEQVAVQAQRQRNRPRQERHDLQQQVHRNQQHLDDRISWRLNGCSVSSARKPPRPFTLML